MPLNNLSNNQMRRLYLRFILLLALCVMGCAMASANVRTVRIGFFEFEGYHNMAPNGERSGYGYDFLCLLQRYSNLRFEYLGENCSWPEAVAMLERGEIDMLTSAQKSADRAQKFAYSLPIGEKAVQLNTLESNNRYLPYDFNHFDGMRVGMINGNSVNEKMIEYAKEQNFSITPVMLANKDEQERALQDGRVDAIVTSTLRKTQGEKTLARFSAHPFYALFQKSDTALLREVNTAIVQMNASEGEWQSRLFIKNYQDIDADKLVFTPLEQAYIRAHSSDENPIILATDNNWFPFSQKQGDSHVGIIPDLWQQILDMTGMKYSYYDCSDDIFSLDDLKQGKADIYLGCTLTPPEAEQQNLLVSAPFMNVDASLLYRRTTPEIHTVALCDVTPNLNKTFVPEDGWTVRHYHTSDDAVRALKAGEVDAVYCYAFDAERHENLDVEGLLVNRMLPGIKIALRAVVALDSDHLLMSIVSKCIGKLHGVPLETIVSNNLTPPPSSFDFTSWRREHKPVVYTVVIAVMLTLMLIVGLFIRLHYRKMVNRKLQSQFDDINHLNVELEQARRQAMAASDAKSAFLFNMSHDIRTPMNAIVGYTNLIENNLDDKEKCRDFLGKVKSANDFLLSLINNVLEMARIESGRVTIEDNVCRLSDIMNEIQGVYTELMREKDIRFEVKHNVSVGAVYTDQTKLEQVLLNLISNSYKYTPRGGQVSMTFTQKPSEREGCVVIETVLSDTGVGMSREYLEHIFEQFTREHSFTESKVQGTGLGMSIVKHLVELMGGTIDIQSEPGKGTTVTLRGDFRIASDMPDGDNAQQCFDHTFKGLRLLMAEDNELNAEIAVETLSEVGIEVQRANNGRVCIDMLCQHPLDYYDAILMDIQMPEMNGYEAARAIRQLPDDRRLIPIVAMTANAFEEDRKDALAAGMNAHLPKPFDAQLLLQTLASLVMRGE